LEKNRLQFSDATVYLCVKPQWSAHNPNYKAEIRRQLAEKLEEYGASRDECFNPLINKDHALYGLPPKIPGFSISISHCRAAGGFAFIKSDTESIGFDVEDPQRVTCEVVARIASQEEVLSAPSPAHLWVAKEAAFKALIGVHQPTTISQVQIFSWIQLSASEWSYLAQVPALPAFGGQVELDQEFNLIVSLSRFKQ